jgi:hypothetical protein
MNKKVALFAVALLVPALMQGCWKGFRPSNPFVNKNAANFRSSCFNQNNEDANAQLAAFDASYKPWMFTASRALFAVSGTSAVVAGTAKYCPQFHNDKVVYAAAATSVLSLVSGYVFNRYATKNYEDAAKHALRVKALPLSSVVSGDSDNNL